MHQIQPWAEGRRPKPLSVCDYKPASLGQRQKCTGRHPIYFYPVLAAETQVLLWNPVASVHAPPHLCADIGPNLCPLLAAQVEVLRQLMDVMRDGFMRRMNAMEEQLGELGNAPKRQDNTFGPIQQNAMAATIMADLLNQVCGGSCVDYG